MQAGREGRGGPQCLLPSSLGSHRKRRALTCSFSESCSVVASPPPLPPPAAAAPPPAPPPAACSAAAPAGSVAEAAAAAAGAERAQQAELQLSLRHGGRKIVACRASPLAPGVRALGAPSQGQGQERALLRG